MIAAWSLFAEAWLTAWLLAPLLALLGVVLVARGSIFHGVAMAQSATVAVALMMFLAAQGLIWCSAPWAVALAALTAASAAALPLARGRSSEAANGWLFLAASAATPLLLTYSPHGLNEVHRLVASSLVGAGRGDVAIFITLLLLAVLVTWRFGARLRLVLLDPEFAADLGLAVGRWQLALALATGLTAGLALRVAGLLYVAGCLLLPALCAAQLCRTTAAIAWCAPLIALVTALTGTVVAHQADLPPAQVTVALLAFFSAVAWSWRRLRA